MTLKKCCFCIDLRVGCIIFSVVGILVNCGFFGKKKDLCGPRPDLILKTYTDECSQGFYIIVAGSVLGIMGNVCLLFGAIRSQMIAVALYLLTDFIRWDYSSSLLSGVSLISAS